MNTATIKSFDGTKLRLLIDLPSAPLATVLMVHGYKEHIERYQPLARYLCSEGFAVVGFDLRGHGQSSGQRGYVRHFDDYLQDIDQVWQQLPPQRPVVLLGHSFGGLLVLSYSLRRRPKLAALVVSNPFLGSTTPPGQALHWFGLGCGYWLPRISLPHVLPPQNLTSDVAVQKTMLTDKAIFHKVNTGWYRQVYLAQQELLQRCEQGASIPAPLLWICSNQDKVCDSTIGLRVCSVLGSPALTLWQRPFEQHEVFQEVHRLELYKQLCQWLKDTVQVGKERD